MFEHDRSAARGQMATRGLYVFEHESELGNAPAHALFERLRIDRAVLGNFGDCAPVGEGVSEMRIHYGPGYRVYFAQRGLEVVILLAGGDKATQVKDIARALELARGL